MTSNDRSTIDWAFSTPLDQIERDEGRLPLADSTGAGLAYLTGSGKAYCGRCADFLIASRTGFVLGAVAVHDEDDEYCGDCGLPLDGKR